MFYSSQVPSLCWRDVIPELDYKGFHLPSPEGLSIVITAFNTACRVSVGVVQMCMYM